MEKKPEIELLDELKHLPAFQKIKLKKENLVDALFSFFKSLMPEEKIVIQILFNSMDPLTTKQIRKRYAIKIAERFVELVEKIDFIKSKLPKNKEELYNISLKNRNRLFLGEEPAVLKILYGLKDREIERLISILNKKLPEKVPSYYKLRKILEYLEEMGLVKHRELIGRKAEKVWYLSPVFSKICSTVTSFIENKVKNEGKTITSVEYDVYNSITGMEPPPVDVEIYDPKLDSLL